MTFRRATSLICVTVLVGATGCRDGQQPRVISSIAVTPQQFTLSVIGAAVQLVAEARDARGTVLSGYSFVWTSSDTGIVQVSSTGLANAVSNGSAIVSAAASGVVGSATVTVAPVIAKVDVTPAGPTLDVLGGTLQLAATARDSAGHVLTGVVFTWASSDSTKVRVSASGLVTALAAGSATVTASTGVVVGATLVRVAPPIVVVTPAMATLLSVGSTLQLTATGTDSAGRVMDGLAFAWSSSDTGVVRVSATGLVTARAAGKATVSAATNGVSGTARITVGPAVTAQVVVTPADPWLFEIGATLQLAAVALDSVGGVIAGVTFTWASSDISKVSVTAAGLVTALGDGTALITVTAGAVVKSVTVTVRQLAAPPSRLAVGYSHTCGLGSGGSAYCWGDDQYGELGDGSSGYGTIGWTPELVLGGLAFQSISASGSHTCGITVAGAAYCWGSVPTQNAISSTPAAVGGNLKFMSISAGDHACGVTQGGEAYCWGYNYHGELGDGTTSNTLVPTRVAGGLTFQTISVSSSHTCGLTVAGAAYCWGSNSYGQLGDGTTTDRTAPVPVALGLTFQALGAGSVHTCALTTSGAAYCWGANYVGQLGDGTTSNRSSPVAVAGGLTFQALSVGSSHTCGVTASGAGQCWGDNDYGQLGDGTTTSRSAPASVEGGLSLRAIGAGGDHTCALAANGAAYCWGESRTGQIGDGSSPNHPTPVAVAGGLDFSQVNTGGSALHTCSLTPSGVAYCWGHNTSGQIGDSTLSFLGPGGGGRPTPSGVVGGHVFQSVSAGEAQTCGLSTDGNAYCWGANSWGQLGNGTTTDSRYPVAVTGGRSFVAVTAGEFHACALTADGSAYCWGMGASGQLGDGFVPARGATDVQSSPVQVIGGQVFKTISAGGSETCGLTLLGAPYCWGSDGTTARSTPGPIAGGLTLRQISVGSQHACGLTTDGAAYCWGSDSKGQLGDGASGTSRATPVAVAGGLTFQSISAGGTHTCGLDLSGIAYCWGSNSNGQVGDGTMTDRLSPTAVVGGMTFRAISAGSHHTCAITTDGTTYCWGDDLFGELGDGSVFRTSPVAVAGGIVFGGTGSSTPAGARP